MNQTHLRRLRMAVDIGRLVRYQSRLCRRMPVTVVDPTDKVPGNKVEAARWLGSIRIGKRNHHALFVPPHLHATYRFVAAPRSRVVAWCGLLSGAVPDG